MISGLVLKYLNEAGLVIARRYETALPRSSQVNLTRPAVLIGAWVFSNFVNLAGLPEGLLDLVTRFDLGPWAVMVMIMLVYLALGCIFESMSMLLLTVPIFFPLVTSLGFDPIWFGIVVVVVIEISLITPPVGLNVFILKGVVDNISTATIFRGVTPFWMMDILRLILLLAFPALVLFLPNQM
ncbi:TRAP transporter large permease subunit [Marimonas sp. MJW-29]|uniref:TRAP transporter large permease subunit n=1 Tax=Sulfitobacter sediminis TaxID=3234186 RepID=A0ABV3RLD1_9RHOB